MRFDATSGGRSRGSSTTRTPYGPGTLDVQLEHVFSADFLKVLRRGVRWLFHLNRFIFTRMCDRLRGTTSVELRGVRLRELFEHMGGTAIKVGQQMAVRVDFLPYEVCRELGLLMDTVPPFPLSDAIAAIEEAAGARIKDVYQEIEPQPIGSASIACVWRGTLVSGQQVAIKVRRPGVEAEFAADLKLIEVATRLMEALVLVRPGFLKNLRSELRDMFLSELDFILEANYQRMYRRLIRRDKLRWVSAPKVHFRLSDRRVLVSDFVDGLSCLKLLEVAELGDRHRLAELEREDISVEKVGQRILQLSLWSRFECFFFHADPHPGNIFILPGNRLAMLDFGSCGINSTRQSGGEFQLTRSFLTRDMAGAADAGISMNSPIPDLELERMRQKVLRIFFTRYFDVTAKDAKWWERTTASLWVSFIEEVREFDVPINVNTLRFSRSSLLYDTLAFRLAPELDYLKVYRRYLRQSMRRKQRRLRRHRQRERRDRTAQRITEIAAFQNRLEKATFWFERFLETAPQNFAAMAGKASLAFSTLIRAGLKGTLLLIVSSAGLVVHAYVRGEPRPLVTFLSTAATHPIILTLLGLLLFFSLSRVRSLLGQVDPNQG